MITKRLGSSFRLVGLVLVLGLMTFLLTGCFDLSIETRIKSLEDDVRTSVLLTTPSESAFEMIKTYLFKEDIIGPDSSEDTNVTISEKGGIYSVQVEKEAPISEMNSYPVNLTVLPKEEGTRIYQITDLKPPEEGKQEEEYERWFEGFNYSFTIQVPGQIKKAWWVNSNGEKLTDLRKRKITESTFSFETPINKIMGLKDEWATRVKLIIETKYPTKK